MGGLGVGGDAARGELGPLVGEVVGGPDGLQHLEGLVEELVATLEVDAEGPVLAAQIAGGYRQGEAPDTKAGLWGWRISG